MRNGVVMTDAGFAAVLGTVLVMGWVFGQIDGDDFAAPAEGGIAAALGLALLALAVGLAELVKREAVTPGVLNGLAAANAGVSALLVVWIAVGDGFSTTGSAVVWTTIVALLLLAGAEAFAARTQPQAGPRR